MRRGAPARWMAPDLNKAPASTLLKKNKYDEPKLKGSGTEFLLVEVTLKVTGRQAKGIGQLDLAVKDPAGTRLEAVPTANSGGIFNVPQPFQPNVGQTAIWVFEVPKGSTGHTATYAPFGAANPATFKLD